MSQALCYSLHGPSPFISPDHPQGTYDYSHFEMKQQCLQEGFAQGHTATKWPSRGPVPDLRPPAILKPSVCSCTYYTYGGGGVGKIHTHVSMDINCICSLKQNWRDSVIPFLLKWSFLILMIPHSYGFIYTFSAFP